jgi:hypothetical protein
MPSEPDSTPRRRPPTIDLTAKEVETEGAGPALDAGAAKPSGNGAEAHAPGGKARWRFVHQFDRLRLQASHLIGAGAGAIVMLAIFAGFWAAGVAPSRSGPTAVTVPSEAAATKEIAARLDKIEATLAQRRPDDALGNRIAAAEAETKSLDTSLDHSVAALNRRLDDIAVTARTALAHADAASSAAEASKGAAQAGVQHADLTALDDRVAALERAQKSLSDDVARRPLSADDRVARLTVVTEALRATVERGAPYAAELGAVKSLGVDDSALGPLAPFAADGLPSPVALAHELAALTPALQRASGTAASENTFLGRLEANAQKLVRVTPIDAPSGDASGMFVARIDADAARGDISAALADIARLPDAERSLVESWTKKAQAREAAITASRRIAADALAALTRPAAR